ncbi:helix-turn-helix domain-containing protein [Paenibacillus sp. OSY-SE]|uniref:helix-turn-helix domain-containing protein n=1 Tax=Paenibacillus sp. OSY-SE TaxID=1196323 RepID=UPI000561F430|nr:helix-turn-helix transcriptional regulator [Paenibacillus sp. OSY-SE]
MNDVIQIQTIGELIHQYRRESGMTLSQLSDITGSHKGTISRIENGDVKRPEFETVHPLASALGIPFEDIVERYIEIDKRADSLQTILQTVIQSGNIELINKVALKFLESPSEDSYSLVERLYTLADAIEDKPIRLSLYRLLIHYSRNHGMMLFLAKGLYAAYLIERDDFSKLETTYQSGKHILNYTNFLSHEEKITLYYKLGVHAYNLMKYEECVDLCEYVIENENTQIKIKANALYASGLAHYYLGNYEKWEYNLKEYATYDFTGIEENKKVTTALVNSKTGKIDLAIEQLNKCLAEVSDQNLIHVVNKLIEIYLQNNNTYIAQQLLIYETRIKNVPLTTPIKRVGFAYYFRLKGKLLYAIEDFEGAFDCYLQSALEYAQISKYDESFESLSFVSKALLENNSLFGLDSIRKIDSVYNELRHKKEE